MPASPVEMTVEHPNVIGIAIAALGGAAVTLAIVATPSAAIGPGGGAIAWVENVHTAAGAVLVVALLRAMATTAGAALLTAAPALAQPAAEDAKLRAMLDQMFETQVDESPRRATSLGLDKGARAALKSQLDDNSLDARAKRRQAELLARFGGRQAALARGDLNYTPAPGQAPDIH